MGIFSIFSRKSGEDLSATRDPASDFWYGPYGAPSAAGVNVTVDTAITVPVVYGCLKVLSETIGTLPFSVFARGGQNQKEKENRHPLMDVLRDPGDGMTSVEFIEQMVWDLATEGNAYFEVLPGPKGPIDRLIRMEPKHVIAERIADRSKRYKYREAGRPEQILNEDQVWHLRVTPLINGLVGLSPIEAGKEAIGAALALQEYGATFFKNDATPPYIIEMDNGFKDEESKKNYLKAIKKWWGGQRRHSPGVLEYGAKAKTLGTSNEDSQFLETRKELAIECTRPWRMPPHKVGILDRATFSNIEQQSLEFVIDTLLPWLRLIEKSVEHNLLINRDRFFFEFNVAGLLRGDIKARFEAYAVGRNWGWLSVNEIRALENMNGVGPAGDEYLQPLNMTRAGMPPDPNDPPRQNGAINGHDAIGGDDPDHPSLN